MSKRGSDTWVTTPPDILNAIRMTEIGVAKLQSLGNAEQLDRKFTLDGRLVGDIGELIVFRSFKAIETTKARGHVHDFTAVINGKKVGVQVKVRRKGKTAKMEFKSRPEVLLALEFSDDWSRWRTIFNGSGAVVRKAGVKTNCDRRFMENGNKTAIGLSISALRAAHRSRRYSSPALKRRKR
jgi:hypothetical protein